MDVLQHTSGTADGLGSRVPQPGEAGWLPPWLRSSSSSESGPDSLWSSSSSESGKPRPLPSAVGALLQSSINSESGESGCPSFEQRCIMNLAKSYLPAPPPPAPAQKITCKTLKYIVHAHPVKIGHKGFQVAGALAVRKNVDFTRCFACSPAMLHPRGDKYIAGHCNVPRIYTNTC